MPKLSVYLILMLFFYLHQEKKFLEDILIKVVDGLLSLKVPSVGAKLVKIELKSAAIPLSLAEVEVYMFKRELRRNFLILH